jgi:hypothetical protein
VGRILDWKYILKSTKLSANLRPLKKQQENKNFVLLQTTAADGRGAEAVSVGGGADGDGGLLPLRRCRRCLPEWCHYWESLRLGLREFNYLILKKWLFAFL